MNKNEKELIEIIRNSSDPEKVMAFIVSIITEWLKENTPKAEDSKK